MIAIDKINPSQMQFLDAFTDMGSTLVRLNIMVAGKIGSGKGPLIDTVFRENLSSSGINKYVSPNLTMAKKDGFPLHIYISKGLNVDEEVPREVKDGIANTISAYHVESGDERAIHCVWYCINSKRQSLDQDEIEWIEELSDKANYAGSELIVVLTDCNEKDDTYALRNSIEAKAHHAGGIVCVQTDGNVPEQDNGLETLITMTKEALPEDFRQTLLYVAKGALKEKGKLAHKIVASATAAAAAAAAAPLPVADSAMLIPIQIAMISSIAVIYAVDLNKAKIRGFISAALGAFGATVVGKTVFSTSLKLFPGAGQVLGGFLNAGTAGVITSVLGEVFIRVMTMIYKGEIDDSVFTSQGGKKMIANMFKNALNRKSSKSKEVSEEVEEE